MTRLDKLQFAVKKGFTYNPETGIITTPTGIDVKSKTTNGYINLSIWYNKKRYSFTGHQFAWYFIHKETVICIDHINGIKSDNRIINLRSVTHSQNAMNMKPQKGITFCKRTNRWVANITVNYKKIYLGSFINEQEALNCYKENKSKYHIIN